MPRGCKYPDLDPAMFADHSHASYRADRTLQIFRGTIGPSHSRLLGLIETLGRTHLPLDLGRPRWGARNWLLEHRLGWLRW